MSTTSKIYEIWTDEDEGGSYGQEMKYRDDRLSYDTIPSGPAFLLETEAPIELRQILEKSGFHQASQTDRPKSPPKIPNKCPDVYSQQWLGDIVHLEKVVGRLLTSGCVTNRQCPSLLEHFAALVRECDNTRLLLQSILGQKPFEEAWEATKQTGTDDRGE